MVLKLFKHYDAKSVEEAVSILGKYKEKAKIIAGGTDLLGALKNKIYPEYPEVLINIKTIPGLSYIKEEAGSLKIGALTSLTEVAESSLVRDKYSALAEAASRVASPQIRNMGTIGGNICQLIRCWYFRAPSIAEGPLKCLRKGGALCYAMAGDNRYHSIFGALEGCVSVNPSDIAPALVALNARIVTNKRTVDAEGFWAVKGPGSTVLDADEIVTEIQVPAPPAGTKSKFLKFALRKSIDFPIVNCASAVTSGGGVVKDARVCLNAVYPIPYRAKKAEDYLKGKSINESTAEEAGEKAVEGAIPLSKNKYKIQIAKTLVERTLLACV